MANDYFKLSTEEKRDALAVASNESGRPLHLLEKDIWVVWALQQLYESAEADHLVFKGGTSLSKAYRAIQRFSEDIDITYDIRAIAGDLVSQTADGLPKTRSQQAKWTDDIRNRLSEWLATKMLPYFQIRLSKTDPSAIASATEDTITIDYKAAASGTGYVAPRIKIEFGARSTGEPSETYPISADAAPYLKEVVFPECNVRTMRAERTFWEKATAIHVFCLQSRLHGERFARHWYDITQLDKIGLVSKALEDRELAKEVAKHKSIFFREKDIDGNVIDHQVAVSIGLRLVPEGEARKILSDDYKKMLEDGLLPGDAETFEEVMTKCADIQRRANKAGDYWYSGLAPK